MSSAAPARGGRKGSRARSAQATPSGVRRSSRLGENRVPANDNDDKPAIANKNSQAYGSSGKIATPLRFNAGQAHTSIAQNMQAALAQAQNTPSNTLPPVSEDQSEGDGGDDEEDAQSQVDQQLRNELRAATPDRDTRGNATSQSNTTSTLWAPNNNNNNSNSNNQPDVASAANTVNAVNATNAINAVNASNAANATNEAGSSDYVNHANAAADANGESATIDGIRYVTILINWLTIWILESLTVAFLWPSEVGIANLASGRHLRVLRAVLFWLITFIILDSVAGPLLPQSADLAIFESTRNYVRYTPTMQVQNVSASSLGLDALANIDANRLQQLLSAPLDTLSHSTSVIPRINWFEAGQGPQIDRRLTSPTYSRSAETWSKAFWTVLKLEPVANIPVGGPDYTALQPWEDGGIERWCAPPSRGKLQFVVDVARPIAPDKLVVEHVSRLRSIMMGSAPREIELFVHIEDTMVRDQVMLHNVKFHPELLIQPSSPQEEREIHDTRELPDSFVSVGRWTFDIWANSEVQSFSISPHLKQLGVKATKLAIRVNSNWGNLGCTCVNRFRLYGQDMSGRQEYLEAP